MEKRIIESQSVPQLYGKFPGQKSCCIWIKDALQQGKPVYLAMWYYDDE